MNSESIVEKHLIVWGNCRSISYTYDPYRLLVQYLGPAPALMDGKIYPYST